MINRLGAYLRSRKAVSTLEYAIIIGVVVVAMAGAAATFRNSITTYLTGVSTTISTLPTTT